MKWPRQLCAFVPALFFSHAVSAQSGWTPPPDVLSVSGQFQVRSVSGFSPLLHQPALATNAEIVRIDPALAAVSAERVKNTLARELGRKSGDLWRGKIFLVIHPAGMTDDAPMITALPILGRRDYRLDLPDVLTRQKFTRSLTAVLLIEMADRESGLGGHPAEIPAWLCDGLARKILADDREKTVLTLPAGMVNGLSQSRSAEAKRGFDPLEQTRQSLRDVPALTFQQLSWPVPGQLSGADHGSYFASSHLLVNELLGLKNAPAKFRALLARLPACENWQTAFFAAFHEDFLRPLDVEKWWALRVVAFALRDSGPQWTGEASRDRLNNLLRVPVEMRRSSNSLPDHAELSLQEAIRTLETAQQEPVLRNRLRDLELAQLRLFPGFAAVAEGYRQALADYLGDPKPRRLARSGKISVTSSRKSTVAGTLKKLDALDIRRQEVERRFNHNASPLNFSAARS